MNAPTTGHERPQLDSRDKQKTSQRNGQRNRHPIGRQSRRQPRTQADPPQGNGCQYAEPEQQGEGQQNQREAHKNQDHKARNPCEHTGRKRDARVLHGRRTHARERRCEPIAERGCERCHEYRQLQRREHALCEWPLLPGRPAEGFGDLAPDLRIGCDVGETACQHHIPCDLGTFRDGEPAGQAGYVTGDRTRYLACAADEPNGAVDRSAGLDRRRAREHRKIPLDSLAICELNPS